MTVHIPLRRRAVQIGTAITYCTSMAVSGATLEEEKLLKAPMPHETLGTSGSRIKVHRVSLRGYLEGSPGNTMRLAQLKEQVQSCLSEHRRSGIQSRPPMQWPDFLTSMREDIYFAVNRSLRYTSAIAYGVNFTDCSLLEVSTSRARLVSSQGVCNVDLVKKTATGLCSGGSSSATAKNPAGRDVTAINAILRKMATDPRASPDAVVFKKMQASSDIRTGERRTILGLECDVWSQTAAGEGATICLARGGSFIPSRLAGNQAEAGLLLEYESKYGAKMKAVDAKFDAEVSSQLFEPHIIMNGSSHK